MSSADSDVEPSSSLDFSRKDYTGPPIKKLIDVVDYVKPTALFGLSTVKVRWVVKP